MKLLLFLKETYTKIILFQTEKLTQSKHDYTWTNFIKARIVSYRIHSFIQSLIHSFIIKIYPFIIISMMIFKPHYEAFVHLHHHLWRLNKSIDKKRRKNKKNNNKIKIEIHACLGTTLIPLGQLLNLRCGITGGGLHNIYLF